MFEGKVVGKGGIIWGFGTDTYILVDLGNVDRNDR